MNKKNAVPILIVNTLILIFAVWVLVARYQKFATRTASRSAAQQESAVKTEPAAEETSAGAEEEKPAAVAPAAPKKIRNILFQYRSSRANAVAVIGDFNDWTPEPMRKTTGSTYEVALKLRPGRYLYNYLIDGKVITDPNNRKPPAESLRGFKSSVLELKEIKSR
jgi:1,4-alpha-glucan branching enzyme